MKKEELLRDLNSVLAEVRRILLENEGSSAHLYTRLLQMRYDVNHDKFDAINYSDILSIDLIGCKSYKELRENIVDSYRVVIGFRNLSIAAIGRENDYRGEYITVNN